MHTQQNIICQESISYIAMNSREELAQKWQRVVPAHKP